MIQKTDAQLARPFALALAGGPKPEADLSAARLTTLDGSQRVDLRARLRAGHAAAATPATSRRPLSPPKIRISRA